MRSWRLQYLGSIDDLPTERKRAKVAAVLEGYANEAVRAEIGKDMIEGDFYERRWRPEPGPNLHRISAATT